MAAKLESALPAREVARWLLFPCLITVVFAILVGLNINGSSLSALLPADQATGVLGEPRPIRSDEFALKTSIAVSSDLQGLPAQQWIGLTLTDQVATSHGGPTLQWSTLFVPQHWGYVFLDAEHGMAFSWWMPYLVALFGCFLLFGLVTRRIALAAGLATVAAFTPYMGWWSSPAPGLILGLGALAAFICVASWRARSIWTAALCSIAAGFSATAFVLVLYPGWQVSLLWVLLPLMVGLIVDWRLSWIRVLWTTVLALAISGTLLAVWFVQNLEAISATSATYYPGHRQSTAGEGSLTMLLSAPLNWWLSGRAGATLGVDPTRPPTNLSEIASVWVSFPLMALIIVGLALSIAHRRRIGKLQVAHSIFSKAGDKRHDPIWALLSTCIAGVLLTLWALAPLPGWVGAATLLERTPASRVPLALGLVMLLQIALVSTFKRRPAVWTWPWLLAAALATGASAVWSWAHMSWDRSLSSPVVVLISGLTVGILLASIMKNSRAPLAAILLATFGLASFLLINPFQRGFGALEDEPIVKKLSSLPAHQQNSRIEVFGDYYTVALVRYAGFQSLSGTTFYPTVDFMEELLPDQESSWNNYAQYLWSPAKPGDKAVIREIQGTMKSLTIDPCDPLLLDYADPGWAISKEQLSAYSCLREIDRFTSLSGENYWLYERVYGK